MKKIFLPLLAVILFITAVGILTQKLQSQIAEPIMKKIRLGSVDVPVEIADSDQKRRKGLSSRDFLAADEGLLFVFGKKDIRPSFWMKDMKFSIDIIWIDDGKIVQIDNNIPVPGPDTPEKELKFYLPNQAIDYVLEVNAGFTEEKNIKVGDLVDLSEI